MFLRAARRLTAVVASVVVLVAGLVTVAAPADAATATLTVTTIDRNGKATREQVEIIDLDAGFPQFQLSGTAHRVRPGTYEVAADVFTAADQSDTVGVRRVKVAGATKVTIDARNGRLVRAALRPAAPAGYLEHFNFAVCPAGMPGLGGWTLGPKFYAIPNSIKDAEFAFSAMWDRGGSTGSPQYAGAATTKGIPAAISRTFAQSSLTTVTIAGRSGLQSGSAQVTLRSRSADQCRESVLQVFTQPTLPYRMTFHVPAGQWEVDQEAQEFISHLQPRTFAAGHAYTVTTGRAAWGPDGHLPYTTSYGHRLYLNTNQMFTDPTLQGGPGTTTASYVLVHARKTVLRRTTRSESGVTKVLKERGWYTLSVTAKRHPRSSLPSTVLSPWSKLRLHFFADPTKSRQVRGYVARFVPAGLGADNRARTRTTTISLSLLRTPSYERDAKQQRDAVKRVRVWMSVNGGKTWHPVRVHNHNGKRSVTVTNPSSGYVSLRASVNDTHGDWSVTELGRAYAIG
jgi:hypothetical protein